MKSISKIVIPLVLLCLFSACGRKEIPLPSPASEVSSVSQSSESPIIPNKPPEEKDEEENPDQTTVTLQDFLETYESFIDRYVAFMKRYKDSDDPLSMLSDYLEILREYTEFETALQGYDLLTMSEADALYYSEVMLRCSQKMLTIAE